MGKGTSQSDKTPSKEQTRQPNKEWRRNTLGAVLIGGLAILAFYLGTIQFAGKLVLALVPMSIIIFFGMMALSTRYAITSQKEDKGIMRKSLTATLVLVFVAVLALAYDGKLNDQTTNNTIVQKLTEEFAYVIVTIIAFYFGTKSVREFLQMKYGKKEEEKKDESTKEMQELDKKNLEKAKEGSTDLKIDDSEWNLTKQKEGFKIGVEKEKEQNEHAQQWTSTVNEQEFQKEPTNEDLENVKKSLESKAPAKPTKECSDGDWQKSEFWTQWSQFKHKTQDKWKVRGYHIIQWECKRS